MAFEGLLAFDLTLAQRACGEARARGFAPPARARQRKAPQDGFVFIEQNDLAAARLVLEGREFERTVGEISRGGEPGDRWDGRSFRPFFSGAADALTAKLGPGLLG